jgi:hypothetical protein
MRLISMTWHGTADSNRLSVPICALVLLICFTLAG